ncbi:MAG: alpha/beta hydrolase [Burkholderiaceae bacterium]
MKDSVLVAIDSAKRRLSVADSGTGEPTVILETGLGADSEEWAPVQDAISQRTRVVSYDRANRAESDPATKPRTVQDSVNDLHALVVALELSGPLVLVGHSLGGLIVRLYAHQHPKQVAALVLVDPMHEDQFDRIGPLLSGLWPGIITNLIPPVRRFTRFWKSGWQDASNNDEGADMVANKLLGHSIDTLGDLPLVILTSGAFVRGGPPGLGWPKAQKEWVRLHQELLKKSTHSRQIMVEQSNHFIQRGHPQVIIEAIQGVLDAKPQTAPAR